MKIKTQLENNLLQQVESSVALQHLNIEKPIIFLAKGTTQTYKIPNSDEFTNFSITPNLPNEVNLNSDGTFVCNCPNNAPFQGGEFTLSYSPKNNQNESYTTNFELYVYSPYQLFAPTTGIGSNTYLDLYPVVFQNKVYVFLNHSPSYKIHLYRWDGASNWTLLDSNFASSIWTSTGVVRAVVFNGKIYVGLKQTTDNYTLYSFDGNTKNLVASYTNPPTIQDASIAIYNNELYLSVLHSYSNTQILKLQGNNFINIASLSYGMFTYLYSWNNKLWSFSSDNSLFKVELINSDNWSSSILVDNLPSGGYFFYTSLVVSFETK